MADVAWRRQERDKARAECERQAEAVKDAVYAEKPIQAELHAGAVMRSCQRWRRAESRLNDALSEVAEAVPYA